MSNKLNFAVCFFTFTLAVSSCNRSRYNYDVPEETISEDTALIKNIVNVSNVDADSTGTNNNFRSASSGYPSSSRGDEYEEMKKDPEYREGGKYDPELYHTDYSADETGERLRREYIDEDGYDANDDYDEYYGYGWRQY